MPDLELQLDAPPPQPLERLFQARVDHTALEIGFGGAEHLVAKARAHPDTGYIGCEPFEEGIAKAVSSIDEYGLKNVRLFQDDARQVITWLPPQCLSEVYILFPDPWPKARHAKRRLVNPALLSMLAPKMKYGAKLRFATDIADYLKTALLAFRGNTSFRWLARSPEDWRERPENWTQTRYEQKAIREGRRCYYLTFERTADGAAGT